MNQDRNQHFHSEQWADFVRNVTPEGERAAMQRHLDAGCTECAQSVVWLRSVVAAAATSVEAPMEIVSRAKAIFGASAATGGWFEKLEVAVAELVFTSYGDWLPSGVRAGGGIGERRVFKTSGYSVDLTMDEGLSFGQIGEIVGQISTEDPEIMLDKVIVQLRVAGKLLGETETNKFGEFVMQRPTSRAATLQFALTRQGKRIDVRLPSEEEDQPR